VAANFVSGDGHEASGTTEHGRTAEQAYKNIQVLKGIPAEELIPSMQFITGSLGVQCSYCHVEGAFEKDDKKAKETARKMISMTATINRNNFDSRTRVTCNSCHRGSTKPVGVPSVKSEGTAISATKMPSTEPSDASAVEDILNRYVAAVGGSEGIRKVSSRLQKGMVDMAGRQFPIEIYAEAPNLRVTVMHLPSGDSITGFDGTTGWLEAPGRPVHFMSHEEARQERFQADLYFPLRIKEVFNQFRLAPPEQIDGRRAAVVIAQRKVRPPVRLYFDEESGLLMRAVHYSETPLGRSPVQTDYSDYRTLNGIKIPYRWTISRPQGRFTVEVEDVQQNIPIDRSKFSRPSEGQSGPS